MARKQDSRGNEGNSRYTSNWIGIYKDERSRVKELGNQGGELLHPDVEQYLSDGWKLSLSYSAQWSNWVVSITPKEVSGFQSNNVYLFRHADFTTCCGYIRYFFAELVENGDDRLRSTDNDFSW